MMIKTIEDLRNATKEEIEEAKKQVSVLDDLYAYIKWLNSAEGGETEVRFKVGWDKHRANAKGLHPSALAKTDPCLLRLYYDVTGDVEPKPKVDVTNYMTFDIGTAAHSLLQTHFLHMYEEQFEEEVWLRDKRILINSSHTDGRFNFQDVRFLLEIKTIKEGGSFGWEKIQDRPFPDNVRQVMTYMALDDCPFGLVFYWCKNNSKMKEHVIVFDDEVWEGLKKTAVLPIVGAVERGEAPVANAGYHCRWCDYLHGCEPGKEQKGAKRNAKRGAVRPRVGARYLRSRRTRS